MLLEVLPAVLPVNVDHATLVDPLSFGPTRCLVVLAVRIDAPRLIDNHLFGGGPGTTFYAVEWGFVLAAAHLTTKTTPILF